MRIDYQTFPDRTAFLEAELERVADGRGRPVVDLPDGVYRPAVGVWRKLKGTATRPIRIIGGRNVIFDGGRRAEGFQREANIEARRTQASSGFPHIGGLGHQGLLCLKSSRYVVLEGLRFIGCWPSAIALKRCWNIHIVDCHFREGSFAIFASGGDDPNRPLEKLFVERCSFVQDISVYADPETAIGDTELDSVRAINRPGRLWRIIPWKHVHGNDSPVGLDEWRAFDGDFLRTFRLRSDCVVKDCVVSHAFNAVHWFNTKPARAEFNNRLRVSGCHFAFIRDNCIEPEHGCSAVWIFHNTFHNIHKTFSFEINRSEHVYVFGNRAWVDSKPGPPIGDGNRGGAVFKLNDVSGPCDLPPLPSCGGHHVFHNSFLLRAAYVKKGALRRFHNVNNAIEYLDRVVVDGDPAMLRWWKSLFGYEVDGAGNASAASGDGKTNFHRDWSALEVTFAGNVVYQKHYPQELVTSARYPTPPGGDPTVRLNGLRARPGFRAPHQGDFRLASGAAARQYARTYCVPAVVGPDWTLDAGEDVGAFVADQLIEPPAGFVAVEVDMS